MSSYKAPRLSRRVAILGLVALSGCGFAPVYAPGGSADGLRGRIDVVPPSDEEGFALVRRFEDRLGQPQGADLKLTADIAISEDSVGFLPNGSISRYNVLGQVRYKLARADDGETVLTGSEQSFTSYSATSTTVATIAARRDARRRLMVILADRIVADILVNADKL